MQKLELNTENVGEKLSKLEVFSDDEFRLGWLFCEESDAIKRHLRCRRVVQRSSIHIFVSGSTRTKESGILAYVVFN